MRWRVARQTPATYNRVSHYTISIYAIKKRRNQTTRYQPLTKINYHYLCGFAEVYIIDKLISWTKQICIELNTLIIGEIHDGDGSSIAVAYIIIPIICIIAFIFLACVIYRQGKGKDYER